MKGPHKRRSAMSPFSPFACAAVLLLVPISTLAQQRPAPPVLTTTRQAHSLTPQEAAHGYAVHLHGLTTFYDPYQDEGRHPALFVQDATGSIFVKVAPGPALPLHTGTVVNVDGITDPGGYAPIVDHSVVKPQPATAALPTPVRVTLPHLLTGADDGQWVELEGIVRAVEFYSHHVVLNLATIDGPIVATGVREEDRDYASLVDAKVLIRAVAAPLVDKKGQMTGARLLFPDWASSIHVEQPGPADPFNLPVRPLDTLLQYSPSLLLEHRVRIHGQVTLAWSGRLICLQEGEQGLCVQTREHTQLSKGALVDVVGYPALDNFQPTLADALVKGAGRAIPDAPHAISLEQADTGNFQGQLVQIEGRLIGRTRVMTDPALLMASASSVFTVILPPGADLADEKRWPSWKEGSTLRLAGVFSGKVDAEQTTRREGISQLESFQILLRAPDDIKVLQTPSWWTAQHSLGVLGLLTSLTLSISVWVVVLRRRVEQQTLIIRRSEERFRHQAEHDALTGLSSRSALQEQFARALEDAERHHTPLALLMMDVDKFKHINDTLGHAAGDEVLCTIAKRLGTCLRKTDILARMGGDEFLALLPGIADPRELHTIGASIVTCVAGPVSFAGGDVPVSISVGIVTFPEGGTTPAALLHSGDMAMYNAKVLGRNRYQIFTPDMATAAPSTAGSNQARAREQSKSQTQFEPRLT